jgi:hypothetical protein
VNAFLELASRHERDHMLQAWARWHCERREEALAGPHGALVSELLAALHGLTLRDGAKIVAFVRAQDWSHVDADVRFTLLREINNAITRLREQAGMAPFDDGVAPERATAFLIIKDVMFGSKPPD